MRLLVVEDDRSLTDLLRRGLERAGNVVDTAHDGCAGLECAAQGRYDALVLDLMLPLLDGLGVSRELRARSVETPILMLTARDALPDRLAGFEAGADDYLTKPFALSELLARLRAITRRAAPSPAAQLVVGDLVLDTRTREVTRGGAPLDLTPREFELLAYLMRHPGQALSRTLILEHVWHHNLDAFANVVDATIRRLRKEVDEGFDAPLIRTVRGVGYKIKA